MFAVVLVAVVVVMVVLARIWSMTIRTPGAAGSATCGRSGPRRSAVFFRSSVIVVGALIAAAAAGSTSAKWLGLLAVALASVNIFGGFAVTARMLAMYKKKDKPAPAAEKKA